MSSSNDLIIRKCVFGNPKEQPSGGTRNVFNTTVLFGNYKLLKRLSKAFDYKLYVMCTQYLFSGNPSITLFADEPFCCRLGIMIDRLIHAGSARRI